MTINEDIKDGKKFFSNIGIVFLGLTLFTILIQLILGVVLKQLPDSLTNSYDFWMIISAICTYIIPLPFFLYIMGKFEKYNIDKKRLGVLKYVACVIVTFGLCYIGNIMGITITSIIGNLINSPITNPVSQLIGNSNIIVTFIVVVIFAPIIEELFFRKILIDRTIKYGGIASILISATLFAFYHGNLNQFFYAFLMGAFFALIYMKTGRIEYTISLHALVNFFGSIAFASLAGMLSSVDSTHISENITSQEIMANFPEYLPLIIGFLMGIFVIVVMVLAIILILLNYNKVEIPKGEVNLGIPALFLNFGMICFIVYYIFEIVGSFFV